MPSRTGEKQNLAFKITSIYQTRMEPSHTDGLRNEDRSQRGQRPEFSQIATDDTHKEPLLKIPVQDLL